MQNTCVVYCEDSNFFLNNFNTEHKVVFFQTLFYILTSSLMLLSKFAIDYFITIPEVYIHTPNYVNNFLRIGCGTPSNLKDFFFNYLGTYYPVIDFVNEFNGHF